MTQSSIPSETSPRTVSALLSAATSPIAKVSLSLSLSLSLSQYIYICGFCLDLCGSGTEIRVFCGRIHESGVPYSDRIRGDGIRRLLREADLHSDQQHHRRLRLGILLRNLISIAVFLFHRKFKSTCT